METVDTTQWKRQKVIDSYHDHKRRLILFATSWGYRSKNGKYEEETHDIPWSTYFQAITDLWNRAATQNVVLDYDADNMSNRITSLLNDYEKYPESVKTGFKPYCIIISKFYTQNKLLCDDMKNASFIQGNDEGKNVFYENFTKWGKNFVRLCENENWNILIDIKDNIDKISDYLQEHDEISL